MLASNGTRLGIISIGAEDKSSNCNSEMDLSSFQVGETIFENILITDKPGDSIPIEYLKSPNDWIEANVLLLEETDYQYIFSSTRELDEAGGDHIFPELKKGCADRSVIISEWRLEDDNKTRRGSINFASYVGKSFFDVNVGGIASEKVPFEVRSKKIGYLSQYPAMIGDISSACMGLTLDRSSPLFQNLQFSDKSRTIHYEDYMFLEYIFKPNNLPLVYEKIRKKPYSRLKRQIRDVPISLAANIDSNSLEEMASGIREYALVAIDRLGSIPHFHGCFPVSMIQSENEDDVDVPENQLIKDLLLSIDFIISRLLSLPDISYGYTWDRLNQLKDLVQSYLSDEWLWDISPLLSFPANSQVMQKREGYAEILQYYLSLNLSFRFRCKEFEENISGYNRKLSQLYEYWCYLELVNSLARVTNTSINYDDLFQRSSDGWSVHLKKGASSIKTFSVLINGEEVKVTMMYNRTFTRRTDHDGFYSYSFPFNPDFSLCVDDGDETYLILFDAKYRSDREMAQTYEGNSDDESQPYKKDDIYKMHTYKDAILRTKGAYIIYPGNGKSGFFEIEVGKVIPSVGAISLTPGDAEIERKRLDWFIKSILTTH